MPLGHGSDGVDEQHFDGPRPLGEWTADVCAALGDDPAAIVSIRVSDETERAAMAERLFQTHALESGIARTDLGLVLVLPEGLGWSTLASTATAPSGKSFPIGLADAGVDGQSVEDAIELALRAALDAFELGAELVVRSRRDDEAALRAEAIESSLKRALETGQGLRLVYQPKFDTQTREVVRAEALLRLTCEQYGEIPPMEFLAVSAKAGLMTEIQRWALRAGIDAASEWSDPGILPFPVSVNVAAEDLFRDDFVSALAESIAAASLDPSMLRLEIPEAGVLFDIDRAVARLDELSALGVSLALDNFGGEESPALGDLKRLPIDVLKVNRSFVLGMEADVSLDALVRAVITLAGALGIQTVATGVETEAQLAHLANYGCTAVQGFMLSEPEGQEEFEARLRRL